MGFQSYKPVTTRVRKANGKTYEYRYAWRGGPRLKAQPGTPAFVVEMERHIRQAKRERAARRREAKSPGAHISRYDAQLAKNVAGYLARNAVWRAQRAGLPCTIDEGWVADTLRKQRHRCAVTGIEFDLAANAAREWKRNPYAPSIDRIIPAKGYMRRNCRIVLLAVNVAINEWGDEMFFKIAEAALKRRDAQLYRRG